MAETRPLIFVWLSQPKDFWSFLCSWGGGMWESIKHEDQDLLWWLVETISKGTAIFVTNN